MGVEVPSDPAPNGYVPNPHQAQIDAALAFLRAEKDNTEGWEDIDAKEGIVMEKKFVQGDNSAIPIVRGRGLVKGLTAAQLLSGILQPSARHLWDARYESGSLLERYSRRTYKFYNVQKGVGWIVSERDIVGVQSVVFAEDENPAAGYEIIQTSVEGDEENKGRVRATLTCAGWSVVQRGDDLEVSYICKINPNGSIPSAVVAKIVQDIPLAAVNLPNFIRERGIPPYIASKELKSQLRTELVDVEAKKHVIKLIGSESEELTIVVDPKLFGGSWQVGVSGNGVAAEKRDDTTAIVKVPAGAGQYEVTISAA